MEEFLNQIRNGVALAELGGHGDGPYCARHGAGAALVVMGTYIVDAGDDVPYSRDFVFKPGRANYADYLREHVTAASEGGAAVAVSVVSVDLADSIDFLLAAEDAGADAVSLCLHSEMKMFVSRNLSSALLLRRNWRTLSEQLEHCLQSLTKPFIAKVGVDTQEEIDAVGVMAEAGVSIVHANVVDATAESGATTIRALKNHGVFLFAGGKIRTVEDARKALSAGADAVALGTAAMQDAALCGQIQAKLGE